MFDCFVGIDISKDFFDVSVEVTGKEKHHQFSQTEKGFQGFLRWLQKIGVVNALFCMEATGAYWYDLADFLSLAGESVSVVNPTCIRRFAQSELKRTKTDKVDAGVISRFARTMNPKQWHPPAPEVCQLQMLVRRLYDLTKIRRQERTRLSTEKSKPCVMDSVNRILKCLDLEIGRIRRQLVAFVGLAPKEIRSGSSIRGRTRLSKTGNARLRSALFLPAIVAKDHNPVIARFYRNLIANGKVPMKAVGASMRKLLHIIF